MRRTLVILAHRDDEIFLIDYFLTCDEIFLVYLTESHNFKARRLESDRAVNYLRGFLNISEISRMEFAEDGKLHEFLSTELLTEMIDVVIKKEITEIASLAYEGGHQDHDAASIFSAALSDFFSLGLFLFPAYKDSARIFPHFHVMKAEGHNKSFRNKRIFLVLWVVMRLMFIYRSQWRTWTGLGPFIMKRSLEEPPYVSKVIDFEFLEHSHCLYERRRRALQSQVLVKLELFWESKEGWPN
jgi:hypothetical protein